MNLLVDEKEGSAATLKYPLVSIDPETSITSKWENIKYRKRTKTIQLFYTSGKYEANCSSNDNVSINGIIKSGLKMSSNPKSGRKNKKA